MIARYAKRREARQVTAEIAEHLSIGIPDRFTDPSDCIHGCNGAPCGSEQCTFVCHPR